MKPFLKEDRGSFTFEATLVFPAFLIFVLAGVFFCIVIFQMGTAHYVAQKAASEVAYTWNNSHKDLETGEFDKQYYTGLGNDGDDGLYWRIFDNGVLQTFGLEGVFNARNEGVKFEKIRNARYKYNNPLEVNVEYNNSIIYSEVEVTAESELYLPSFLKNMLGNGSNSLEATSSRVVTETPELIRTFNFSKYLWKATGLQDATNDIINSTKEFFGE
ncbi:TadE family protein [Lentibacillus salicampi]|uniref:Pilus assembly protein n=1 Tax=Lentibacillus salicampi TaxID=175306 RepID=A0A4Y9A7N1_9BACI|nr:TadE family protein [Lentibacillus salicampi]TFJ91202.1 pilus assembly protein [Lentibacillus salicampi]